MNKLHLTLLAAALLGLAACKKSETSEAEKTEVAPISVVTEVANATADYARTTYVGTIEESTSTPVSFTGVGVVTRVYVSEGQHVSKGQLIAQLDDTQARNMLATAEAQMAQATDALVRMKQLHDSGSLPDIKWIEVQSQVSQAKSQLDMAKKNLADCKIYAPVSGVVGQKVFENGMTAVTSEPIVSIMDISTVKVRVAIPEREIAAITSGTPSTVHVEAVGRTMEGGRVEKCVTADATTHTYDIKIALPNRDGALMPGMIAEVKMGNPSAAAGSAITLPIRSVQQGGDGHHFVWTAEGGKAHRQPVELGAAYGNRVVIASGLKGGEKVITEGYQKVGEGTKVK